MLRILVTVTTAALAATSELEGSNMTLQRRDAIKSLISIGLTVTASTAAQGKTVEISMTGSAFVPPAITISAGDEVTWKNPAVLLHTVTFDPAQAEDKSNVKLPDGVQPFGSGDLSEGDTFTHRFAEKGTYAYLCKYHESMGMKGVVIVS